MDLKEIGLLCTGLMWIRLETGGGWWKRWWTFVLHKMWGNSWPAVELLNFLRRISLLILG